MGTDKQVLLDLSTLTERKQITIDGVAFEMRDPDEFSILDNHRFARMGKRLDALMNKDALSEAEEKELADTLDRLAQKILDAPDSVHARLRDNHRLQIIRTFTQLQRARLEPAKAGAQVEATTAETGAS